MPRALTKIGIVMLRHINKHRLGQSLAFSFLAGLSLSTEALGQTVDTECSQFGGTVRCQSTQRPAPENGWERLNKTLDSINESRRRQEEANDRIQRSKERRELLELEMKRMQKETAELNRIARQRGMESENRKNFLDRVSSAILEGRCGDATFLALAWSDLETASRVKSLCQPKSEIPWPIIKPKNTVESAILQLFMDFFSGKTAKFSPDGILLTEGRDVKSIKWGFTFLNFGLQRGEPNAFFYSSLSRFHKGILRFSAKDAYILYSIGVVIEGAAASDLNRQMAALMRNMLSETETYEADGIVSYCAAHISECYRDRRIPRNPEP